MLSQALNPVSHEQVFFLRDKNVYVLNQKTKQTQQVTTSGDVRLLAPGKPGTIVYATEERQLKQYDVSTKRTKDIATLTKVPDTITIDYPPRKQYVYFKSGDNIIQVSCLIYRLCLFLIMCHLFNDCDELISRFVQLFKPHPPPTAHFLPYYIVIILFQVNKDNPDDKRTIRRRGAVKYTIDNRRDILFYLTEDGSLKKEPLDSK